MRTGLCVGAGVCLLALGAAMLVSASNVFVLMHLRCCHRGSRAVRGEIAECYEQMPRWDCKPHVYVVKGQGQDGWQCVRPDSKKLKRKLTKAKIQCRPVFGHTNLEYEVLD